MWQNSHVANAQRRAQARSGLATEAVGGRDDVQRAVGAGSDKAERESSILRLFQTWRGRYNGSPQAREVKPAQPTGAVVPLLPPVNLRREAPNLVRKRADLAAKRTQHAADAFESVHHVVHFD